MRIKCLAQGHYHCYQKIQSRDLTIESPWSYPLSHNSYKTLFEAVHQFRSVVMDADSRGTTAHAHQCCILQSYAKTVPSRMKLTMREPASMTTDKGSWRVTSYFYSAYSYKRYASIIPIVPQKNYNQNFSINRFQTCELICICFRMINL